MRERHEGLYRMHSEEKETLLLIRPPENDDNGRFAICDDHEAAPDHESRADHHA